MNARIDDPRDCELGDVLREYSDFEHWQAVRDDAETALYEHEGEEDADEESA